ESEIEDIRRLLNRRRFAAKRGVSVAVETGNAGESAEAMSLEVLAKPGTSSKATEATATAAPWLPTGDGVVFVRGDQTMLPGTGGGLFAPVPADGERVRLTSALPPMEGSALQAVAMFRGNEFVAPFVRPGLSGVVVDCEPKSYDSAQITLFGDRPQ